jgi:hypothetical protein
MCGCYDNDVIVDRSGLDTVSGEHGNVYIDVQDGSGGDHIFAGAGYDKVCADSGGLLTKVAKATKLLLRQVHHLQSHSPFTRR